MTEKVKDNWNLLTKDEFMDWYFKEQRKKLSEVLEDQDDLDGHMRNAQLFISESTKNQ